MTPGTLRDLREQVTKHKERTKTRNKEQRHRHTGRCGFADQLKACNKYRHEYHWLDYSPHKTQAAIAVAGF